MVMKRPMVAVLTQVLHAIRSRFMRRARLEAENLLLRQQLVILRRKSPTRVNCGIMRPPVCQRRLKPHAGVGQFSIGDWSDPFGLDTSKPLNWTRSQGKTISVSPPE
jgi:hypothetical protein